MEKDIAIRRALWCSVAFNLMGALMFLFPEGPLGRLVGMPVPVPPLYNSTVALFIVLFGVAYAWLARSPVIDRASVAFGAIGKASFFFLVLSFWISGAAPGLMVLAASGDLMFAAFFARWLLFKE